MKIYHVFLFLICATALSCKEEEPEVVVESVIHPSYDEQDSCDNTTFIFDEFTINELALSERAYADTVTSLDFPELRDDHNILLHTYNNKLDYHPVAMCAHALELLDVYRRTNDPSYLARTIDHADKLMGISLAVDSTLFFPYSFSYSFYDRDKMVAPWYSGMAQGRTLSLFSRLYEITSDKKYLEIASKIYATFNNLKPTHNPWISCIDKNNNLWFEEYPYDAPSHVLNGMIFAIYGVYDYYMIQKTDDVATKLKGAITTIKRNMHLIREEGDLSFYCFKYTVKNPNYHPIHIEQLAMLHKISGFEEFKTMSDNLLKDTPGNLVAE